jgi:hypothetical protein
MSQSFAWRYQATWMLLNGEAYWMTVPDRTGDLAQIYPLPANRVKPIPWSADEMDAFKRSGQPLPSFVRCFAYTPVDGRQPELLDPSQVVFHRFPNPFEYYRGLSPLTAYLLGLQLDTEAEKFDLADYQNGLTLRHLIGLPPEMSDTDFLRSKAEINAGASNGDRYLVSRTGDVKVTEMASRRGDNKEGDTTRQLTRTEANYVYGIPDGLRDKSATQANADTADRLFKEKTVWPFMCLLAEDLTAQLLIRYYGDDYRAVFEDIRPVDRQLLMAEEDHHRKVLTYDEAREEAGLEPHPDPDVGSAPFEAAGEIAKLKVSMSKLPGPGQAGQPGQPFGEPGAGGDADSEDDTPEAPEPDEAEKAKDLHRWQSVALRLWRRGDDPGGYLFESKHIGANDVNLIRLRLSGAGTESEVKAAFDTSHIGELSGLPCPLCSHAETTRYNDHGGLCVCKGCGMTFDPEVEIWQVGGR